MKNLFSLTEYGQSKPIVLPYYSKQFDYTLDTIDCKCVKCNKNVESMRGVITENGNCIDLRLAGVCHECMIINSYRFRVYPHESRVVVYNEKGFKEYSMTPITTFSKIKSIIISFIKKYMF